MQCDCARSHAAMQPAHPARQARPDLGVHLGRAPVTWRRAGSTGRDGANSDAIMVLRFAVFQAGRWRGLGLVEPRAGAEAVVERGLGCQTQTHNGCDVRGRVVKVIRHPGRVWYAIDAEWVSR